MKRLLVFALCTLLAFACTAPEKKQTPEPQQEPERVDENGLALASLSVINMREDPDYAAELGTQAGLCRRTRHTGPDGNPRQGTLS